MAKKGAVRFSDIIRQFNGDGDDFAEWVEKLEFVASLQGVTDMEKFLPLFLSGGAYAVYQAIPIGDKNDYATVKSCLLKAFSADPFNAYEQFLSRRLLPGESVDVYLADLKRLAGLVDSTVSDHWLKCAFISGLPDNARSQLRAACSVDSMSLNGVLERARTLLKSAETCMVSLARKPVSTCFACGESGHFRRACPRMPAAIGKFSSSSVRRGQAQGTRQCYVCGDSSHLAPACPSRYGAQGSKNE